MIKYTKKDKHLLVPSSLGNFSGDEGASIEQIEKAKEEGYQQGKAAQKAKLTDITIKSNGVYSRDDGWNRIDVNVESEGETLELDVPDQYYLDKETCRIEMTPIMKSIADNNYTIKGYTSVHLPHGILPDIDILTKDEIDFFLGTLTNSASVRASHYMKAEDVATVLKYYSIAEGLDEFRYNNFVNDRCFATRTYGLRLNIHLVNDGGIFTGERWNSMLPPYGAKWYPDLDDFSGSMRGVMYVEDDTRVTVRPSGTINYFIQPHIDLNEYIGSDDVPSFPSNITDIKGFLVPLKTDRNVDLSDFKNLDVQTIQYLADNLVESTKISTIKVSPELFNAIPNSIKAIINSKNWNIL